MKTKTYIKIEGHKHITSFYFKAKNGKDYHSWECFIYRLCAEIKKFDQFKWSGQTSSALTIISHIYDILNCHKRPSSYKEIGIYPIGKRIKITYTYDNYGWYTIVKDRVLNRLLVHVINRLNKGAEKYEQTLIEFKNCAI